MIFPSEISKLSGKTGIRDKTIEKDYVLAHSISRILAKQ